VYISAVPGRHAYFYHFGDTGRPNLRRETVIAGVRNRADAVAIKAQAAHGGGQCRTIIGPGRLSGQDDCRTPLN